MSDDEWSKIRGVVSRLLRARRQEAAAAQLQRMPFEWVDGSNFFGDEFSVLRAVVPVEQYVALQEAQLDKTIEQPFRIIAEAISEIYPQRPCVRFAVAQLATDEDTLSVPPPFPRITSESVDSALADAELLARSRGPANAIDRVHTAVHGYLRAAIERTGGNPTPLASVTELLKQLRASDDRLRSMVTGGDETKRIVMSLAAIVDAINTIRNTASAAHPSGHKLEYAEAMLVINVAHSIIHYLDSKLGDT
ncbi:MAG: abortive infection family protein [Gemmatimonadaceae bacterium]